MQYLEVLKFKLVLIIRIFARASSKYTQNLCKFMLFSVNCLQYGNTTKLNAGRGLDMAYRPPYVTRLTCKSNGHLSSDAEPS